MINNPYLTELTLHYRSKNDFTNMIYTEFAAAKSRQYNNKYYTMELHR